MASRICMEYMGVFPTVLFCCDDYLHSMHFVLSLKKANEKQINDLVKIMTHCGAEMSFDLKEATDYSAVIADHNDVLDFFGPVFTLSYIEECLSKRKLQDISNFRQEATSDIARGANCMRVVYYKRLGWSSLINGESDPIAGSCDENMNRLDSSTTEVVQEENHQSEDELSDDLDLSDYETEESTDGNRREEESMANYHSEVTNNLSKTQDEQKDIASSMQNDNLNCALLPSNVGKEAISGTIVSKNTNSQNVACGASSSKWSFLDDFESEPESLDGNKIQKKYDKRPRHPYSIDERFNILKYIVKHNEYSRLKGRELWEIMESRKVCPSRTWQSMKEHFIKKIVIDLEPYTFLTNEQKKKIKSAFF
uniref:Telomeric repeat-binding factor 2-interacting protein 1 n=1 Tax=Graphocephala atropunctata TaxID=36148 RepID=A0A1B6M684_9HEMI